MENRKCDACLCERNDIKDTNQGESFCTDCLIDFALDPHCNPDKKPVLEWIDQETRN